MAPYNLTSASDAVAVRASAPAFALVLPRPAPPVIGEQTEKTISIDNKIAIIFLLFLPILFTSICLLLLVLFSLFSILVLNCLYIIWFNDLHRIYNLSLKMNRLPPGHKRSSSSYHTLLP